MLFNNFIAKISITLSNTNDPDVMQQKIKKILEKNIPNSNVSGVETVRSDSKLHLHLTINSKISISDDSLAYNIRNIYKSNSDYDITGLN